MTFLKQEAKKKFTLEEISGDYIVHKKPKPRQKKLTNPPNKQTKYQNDHKTITKQKKKTKQQATKNPSNKQKYYQKETNPKDPPPPKIINVSKQAEMWLEY